MIVALTQVLVLGLPLALLLDREGSRRRLLGLAFLLGSGAVSLILLALPTWSLIVVTTSIVAIAAILWLVAKRRAWLQPAPPHGGGGLKPTLR